MPNFKIQVPIGLSLIIHVIGVLILVCSLTSTINKDLASRAQATGPPVPVPNVEEPVAGNLAANITTTTTTTANTTANQSTTLPPPSTLHTGKPVRQQCLTTVLACIGAYMLVWLTSIVVESVIYGYSMSAADAADAAELMNCRQFRLMLINKFGILVVEMLALIIVTEVVGNRIGYYDSADPDDDPGCRQLPMTAKLIQLTVAWWSMFGTGAIMIIIYKLYTNYMDTVIDYYRYY
ncbi:uncharacterized protein LOC128955470 [Oppia nitens]|uniref:uncharacterized protein LOC128955470 n=1 Tax=Oppia nitens TaxID=1686743 RepID=UPI0023D9ACF7|nr:uncharacterized protein LOC128955470 [Oppia nitens]